MEMPDFLDLYKVPGPSASLGARVEITWHLLLRMTQAPKSFPTKSGCEKVSSLMKKQIAFYLQSPERAARSATTLSQDLDALSLESPGATPFGSRASVERLRRNSSVDHSSVPVPKFNLGGKLDSRVRDQSIETVLAKLSASERADWLRLSGYMGCILIPGQPVVMGSCILVDSDKVVTNAHCVHGNNQSVRFTDYSISPPTIHTYEATPIRDGGASAKRLGIEAANGKDVLLLQIQNKKAGQFPVDIAKVTAAPDIPPQTLTHLGFFRGKLRVSVASWRTSLVTEMIQKNMSLLGCHLSWTDFNTHGTVIEESIDAADHSRRLKVRSAGQTHTFEVSSEGAVKVFLTRQSKMDLKLEQAILVGVDHAIVGHKTGAASSGGGYWYKQDGRWYLYGIHCGKVPQTLIASDVAHHFENHALLFLDTPLTIPFILEMLVLEGKEFPFKDLKSPSESFLNRKINCKTNGGIDLGYVSSIRLRSDERGLGLVIKTHDKDRVPCAQIFRDLTKDRVVYKIGEDAIQTGVRQDFELLPATLHLPVYEYLLDTQQNGEGMDQNLVVGRWQRLDNGTCISGISGNGSGYSEMRSDDDRALIRLFEAAINSREFSLPQLTNGSRNTPLFSATNDPQLSRIIGHTGSSVPDNASASATDVKLYLDDTRRAVYTYGTDRRLTYNAELSRLASH